MASQVASSSRRALSTAARVSIDWSREVWSSSPEVAAKANKIKAWVGLTDSLYEKYTAPPAPVDFASAKKSVRDTGFVDQLEAFYKSSTAPAEVHEFPEAEKVAAEQKIAYLTELDALNKEFLPVIEAEIDFQKKNRTTADTTIFDLKLAYPLIHEEIEDELERREWFKDTGIGASGK